ncbi:MAG: hypothetical protein WBM08_02805, partial [Prochlorococcaceae cyanobacterium]
MAPFPLLSWWRPDGESALCRTATASDASLEAAVGTVVRELDSRAFSAARPAEGTESVRSPGAIVTPVPLVIGVVIVPA